MLFFKGADKMNIWALLAYVFIAAYTPGPNNIMAMTNSIRHGFARAMVFCAGAFMGCIAVMTLCALATSFLYEYIPAVEPAMRWIGAAYIVYLAVAVYRDKGEQGGERSTLAPDSFFTGVMMQLVNVKVILYGITTFSTFILPYHRSAGALALAVLFLAVVCSSANTCWALFGTLFQRFHAAYRGPLNTVMALLLAYCAVGIAAP